MVDSTRRLSVIIYGELFRTRAVPLAAAMSYYFLLALLPLLIFLSAMLGYLPIPNLFDQLLKDLGRDGAPAGYADGGRILTALVGTHQQPPMLSFGLLG